jgi:hypothetical protein
MQGVDKCYICKPGQLPNRNNVENILIVLPEYQGSPIQGPAPAIVSEGQAAVAKSRGISRQDLDTAAACLYHGNL